MHFVVLIISYIYRLQSNMEGIIDTLEGELPLYRGSLSWGS